MVSATRSRGTRLIRATVSAPPLPPLPVAQRARPNCVSSGEPIYECVQETDGDYSRSLSHRHQSHLLPSPVRFNFKLVYRWLGEREIFPSVSFNLLNYWKRSSKWEMRKNHVLMYYDYNKKLSINVQLNLFILLFANIFDFYYIKQRSSSLYK